MVDEVKGNKGLKADNDWEYVKNMEIQDDELCLFVLNGNLIFETLKQTVTLIKVNAAGCMLINCLLI